ncbi:MAG: YraN family protein [Minisyncoccia bacterium]|jgi:putative endonuclease
MKTEKRRKGDIGEDVTCKYLENKGYKVVERNYLKPWGEIDIVAEKGNILSFVEVKTVTCENLSGNNMRPEENFHINKLKRLHRAIQTYLLQHKVPESKPWQIELACVYLNVTSHKAHVELMENIVL